MTNAKLHIAPGLTLPVDAVTQTFAFLAKRGAGKTYTASVVAEEMLKAQLQICVVDPTDVWWGLRSSADGKAPGFPIIVMGGEHGDVPLEETAGETVARFLVEEGVPVVLSLKHLRKGAQVRFMTAFAEALYHYNRSPLHIFWDECDAHMPQRPFKEQQRLLGAGEDIVRRGRANGLGVSLISQRAAVVNKDVLTQTEVLVVLRTTGPQDIDAVQAWVKQHDVYDQASEMLASLPSLPIGEAWFWSPGWLDLFKRVSVRERTTFNSSRTPTVGERIIKPKAVAEVDLTRLAQRIAATIEKAKAEDPKELKKRIAQLEAEARKKPAPAPAAAVEDPKTFERRVERALAPILKEAEARDRQLRGLVDRLGTTMNRMVTLAGEGAAAANAVHEFLATPVASNGHGSANAGRLLGAEEHRGNPQSARRLSRALPERRPEATHAEAGRRDDHPSPLPRGEHAILTAVAQHPDGVTREQLTVLTGYKRSSRDTYLQRLGAAGLVTVNADGTISATPAGLDRLGTDFEPLPTGDELRAYWLNRLPLGEQTILRALTEAYPHGIDRGELSARTNYKRSSRDTYLQRLGARKLVTVDADSSVRASDILFD